MTLRLASLAFFLASLAVGTVGLTFAPVVLRWVELTRRFVPPDSVEAALLGPGERGRCRRISSLTCC